MSKLIDNLNRFFHSDYDDVQWLDRWEKAIAARNAKEQVSDEPA